MKILILAACLLLASCAQWQQLTPPQQDKWKTAGKVVGGVALGAILTYDSGDSVTINQHHDDCHPPGHCRD